MSKYKKIDPPQDIDKKKEYVDEEISATIVRYKFARKLYNIYALRYALVTVISVQLCEFLDIQDSVKKNFKAFSFFPTITFCGMIYFTFCKEVYRKTPINYIILGATIVTEAWYIAVFTAGTNYHGILISYSLTGFVCATTVLLTHQTKIDVSSFGGLFTIYLSLLVTSCLAHAYAKNEIVAIAIEHASIAAFLNLFILWNSMNFILIKYPSWPAVLSEENIFASLRWYLVLVTAYGPTAISCIFLTDLITETDLDISLYTLFILVCFLTSIYMFYGFSSEEDDLKNDICIICTILFAYLCYSMIYTLWVREKYKYLVFPEESVFAAMCLYFNIMALFFYFLKKNLHQSCEIKETVPLLPTDKASIKPTVP